MNTILNNAYIHYAHRKQNNDNITIYETLQEHSELCIKYFDKIYNDKKLHNRFRAIEGRLLHNASDKTIETFRELIRETILMHDLGKINPVFQRSKMKNEKNAYSKNDCNLFINTQGNHSKLSSVMYMSIQKDKVINIIDDITDEEAMMLLAIVYINAYIISKHHSDLDNFDKFIKSIEEETDDTRNLLEILSNTECKLLNIELNNIEEYVTEAAIEGICELNSTTEKTIALYTYTRLLFSLLLASDYYATSEFMSNIEINDFGNIDDISLFEEEYKNTDISKAIRKYEQEDYEKKTKEELEHETNINVLRTEMFLDSERELLKNIDKNIFYLEAPTGCGKSNVALNLAMQIIKNDRSIKKVINVYPFNTLAEQSASNFEEIFCNNKKVMDSIVTVNSLTPIKKNEDAINAAKNEEEELLYYNKALLDRQFLNYSFILTSHVSLFNIMFSNRKENCFSFNQLSNSVIILDEIQTYKNTIWKEIITFLNNFADILNIKVIIMSATLPNLQYLVDMEDANTVTLIKDRDKFFNNKLFKERVEINYELMTSKVHDTADDSVLEHIRENEFYNKKVLIQFIKKKSAYEFYDKLKEAFPDKKIELMTGDDSVAERKRIIKNVKECDKIMLVATQVVEAGVDIDMDVAYKTISKMDSEEQLLGRVNRSCKKSGKGYFFYKDDFNMIYKNDVRTDNKNLTLLNNSVREYLISKEFKQYYKLCMDILKSNYTTDFNKFFKHEVGKLNFRKIDEHMKLIDNEQDWSMDVFLNIDVELEDKILSGSDVWNEYKELLENKDSLEYSIMKIRLSEVRSRMNNFIYTVKKSDISYDDKIGDMYYLEDGYSYLKNGKIDREKFETTNSFI